MTLIEYRHLRRITGGQLASVIGVSQATVSRLEAGTISPSRAMVLRIREVTEGLVQPNDLFPMRTE